MLSDCKKGDWFILKIPRSPRHHIGVVLEELKVNSHGYKLLFHATVDENNTYIKPLEHFQRAFWNSNNRFISPYKPTIEEVFKIKQTQEKD